MITFNHFNFNVLDLEKSLDFYKEALDLSVVREKNASDGSFRLVYLGDGETSFTLELTWLKDRKEPYNLGDEEFHLAFTTDDYDALYERHKRWAVFVLKIRIWESISSMIRMATGLKLFRQNKIYL